MSITLATANAYFSPTTHTLSKVWLSFDTNLRTAAIAEAKRLLCRAIGREVEEDASLITDAIREDLATYEQALYLLRNSPAAAEGQEGVEGYLANDPGNPDNPRPMDQGHIAPAARRWLSPARTNGRPAPIVELARG